MAAFEYVVRNASRSLLIFIRYSLLFGKWDLTGEPSKSNVM